MARHDWTYIQISKQMAEALDKFLRTDTARKYSISDKNQLVRYLIIRFLENYQKEYGLLIPQKNMESIRKSLMTEEATGFREMLYYTTYTKPGFEGSFTR